MTIVNDQDKPNLDDALVHFGKKGMKWGVRKDDSKSPSAVLNRTHFSDKEIHTARKNQKARAAAYQKEVDKSQRDPKDKKHLLYTEELDRVRTNWADNQDRYVANRKTRGEKFVATLLLGAAGKTLTSDKRTLARVANESPVKYKATRKYPVAKT